MEWNYGAQLLKERRLLSEFVFIPIKKWTLILKMAEIEVLHMKPRHQYHLSQRREWTYGAQSLNEKRLLHESKYIQIERWTLVLKMVEREVFVAKPSINIVNPNKENVLMDPNHGIKEINTWIHAYPNR